MMRSVTEAQIDDSRATGHRVASELNRLFETHRATDLYVDGTLKLAPNRRPVRRGSFGIARWRQAVGESPCESLGSHCAVCMAV